MTETTATTTRFCFDRSWSGGNPPDRDGIEAILDDMVNEDGHGRIEGEGDDLVVIIEGNFEHGHLEKVANELADWGMRRECCE